MVRRAHREPNILPLCRHLARALRSVRLDGSPHLTEHAPYLASSNAIPPHQPAPL
jgi:hypothetical protein